MQPRETLHRSWPPPEMKFYTYVSTKLNAQGFNKGLWISYFSTCFVGSTQQSRPFQTHPLQIHIRVDMYCGLSVGSSTHPRASRVPNC